jgi:thiosulfate/3-mercaptopyruvate sulfurtransferase
MSILIEASRLRQLIDEPGKPVVVLDVRWRLDQPNGLDDYLGGHIPGARYADLDTDLADIDPGAPERGRHPLPDIARLQETARGWGISTGSTVVVYDDNHSQGAARAWWLLRYAGVADVRLLDGGLAAWLAGGYKLDSGQVAEAPGDVTLTGGTLPVLTHADVLDFAREHLLLDARAAERYRGEQEPIDPKAGHVPGAVNAPTLENLGADDRFLTPQELRGRFEALGATDKTVGVYCGSGVTAAHSALALTVAGFEPVLYPGSWSEWSNHPELPVATGPEPGDAPGALLTDGE